MEKDKVYLGDCMEYLPQLADDSVTMTLTDVPYNEINRDNNGLRNLDKGVADSSEFDLDAVLKQLWRVTKGSFYIFCGYGQLSQIEKFFVAKGCPVRIIVWEKNNPSPMNGDKLWLSGIELAVFSRKPKACFNFNCLNTVLKFPVAEATGHPTPKPVNLFSTLILASSQEGDTVLDPFIGGGTTGVAALKMGRHYIGMEKEKTYYDIATKRIWEQKRQLTLF